jgi:hypothetical protein
VKFRPPVVEVGDLRLHSAASNRKVAEAVAEAVACPPICTIPYRHPDTMEVAEIATTEIGIATETSTIEIPPANANTVRVLLLGEDGMAAAAETMIEMAVAVATTTIRTNPANHIHPSSTSKNPCSVSTCGRKPTKAKPMRITTGIANPIA